MTAAGSCQYKNGQYLQQFSLIWLDLNLADNREFERKLYSIINHFSNFQDLEQCQQYIQQMSSTNQLILIVNSHLGRQLIPFAHQLQQVISIYIHSTDIELDKQYFEKYSKVIFSLNEKSTYSHLIQNRSKVF